jgi:hypothetical protein
MSVPQPMKFVVKAKEEKISGSGVRHFRLTLEDDLTQKFSTSWLEVRSEVFDSVAVGGELSLALAGETSEKDVQDAE